MGYLLYGTPEGIRTPDTQVRSLVLYPAELRVRIGKNYGSLEVLRAKKIPKSVAFSTIGGLWLSNLIFLRWLYSLHFPFGPGFQEDHA